MRTIDKALRVIKERRRGVEQARTRERDRSQVVGLLMRVARFPGGGMELREFCQAWAPLWLEAAREVSKHGYRTTRGIVLPDDELRVIGQELFEKALDDGERHRFADELFSVCRQLQDDAADRWGLCSFFEVLAERLSDREARPQARTYSIGETYAKLQTSGLRGVSTEAFRKWPYNARRGHKVRWPFKERILHAWRENLSAFDGDEIDRIRHDMDTKIAKLTAGGMGSEDAIQLLNEDEFRT